MAIGLDASTLAFIGALGAIAGFVVTVIITSVRGTWKLAQVKEELVQDIVQVKAEMENEITDHKLEVEESINRSRRETGEGLSALRQKIHEFEMYSRDHFVNQKTFDQFVLQWQIGMRDLGNKVDDGMTRLADKIDDKLGREGR